jgi:hypothetical protein
MTDQEHEATVSQHSDGSTVPWKRDALRPVETVILWVLDTSLNLKISSRRKR